MRAGPLSRSLSLIAGVVGGLLLAVSIELPGSIDPATEAWISGALEEAADDGAELAIIRLDTPGGLDTSMREIVKDVIAAPMPVVVYVSPNGARAASAGLFVTQAADVAAMAPQTVAGGLPDGIVPVALSEPTDSLETCLVLRADDTSPAVAAFVAVGRSTSF